MNRAADRQIELEGKSVARSAQPLTGLPVTCGRMRFTPKKKTKYLLLLLHLLAGSKVRVVHVVTPPAGPRVNTASATLLLLLQLLPLPLLLLQEQVVIIPAHERRSPHPAAAPAPAKAAGRFRTGPAKNKKKKRAREREREAAVFAWNTSVKIIRRFNKKNGTVGGVEETMQATTRPNAGTQLQFMGANVSMCPIPHKIPHPLDRFSSLGYFDSKRRFGPPKGEFGKTLSGATKCRNTTGKRVVSYCDIVLVAG